ncbi:peptidase [Streptomyces venezuelae]|uniref:peptidase n=1 Tax=Streptomyces venezuelae TaxID=54571 RepID=UPI00278C59E5|nr:peptidase [Streptomyces venezuelae]
MKIRRILATAVAAAVTTPVVFLSAAPAFADTKPTPASTQKPAADEDGPDEDFAEYEKLVAAVEKADAKVKALKAEREALLDDLRANNVSEAVKTEYTAAKQAVADAETAKSAADTKLAEAKKALAKLEADPDATAEQKTAAAEAVTLAETKVAEAATAKATADERFGRAADARADELVEMSRQTGVLKTKIAEAEAELAAAEKALEEFEGTDPECTEDRSVLVDLTGPKTIAAGTSAVFSLSIKNNAPRTLDSVNALAFATNLPDDWEDVLEGEKPEQFITVEWTGAGNPHWSPITEEFDTIEVGSLAVGKKADVKLRLTLDPKTPLGKGVAFSTGAYENKDGSCGISEQYSNAYFDIVSGKTDKPKPTPSKTTATPTPAPTGGGNNVSQQGGSSNTPVKGSLAATGANDTLPLGLAATAAVALGAGALVVARRRKADGNA